MLCMASCCSGITVICTATRFQAAPLLAPGFTPAVSTSPLPSYLHTLSVLSPCHAEGERSWSSSRAGRVLAQVSVTKLRLTKCECVWLTGICLYGGIPRCSTSLCIVSWSDAEPSLPKLCWSQLTQRKGETKSGISECAAILHNCESKPGEFSPPVGEQAQARKLRRISLNPLA